MKQLLKCLKDKKLIALEQHALLKHNFGGMAKELFQNQLKNTGKTTFGHCYTNETTVCINTALLFTKSI